ncbi:glycosyl transferase family 1 [Dyella subtropica]|uniref:glycosyl transferase family 1 n=1 Tax=Dyella subtropica TaxID=2992127 RepID=UPI002256C243|nr:glycosyl transferase family 1 [Dyella subtropica]
MSLSINLIAPDNGLGLSRDLQLTAAALEACGCTVHFTRLTEADERVRWRLGRGGWRGALRRLRHALQHREPPRFDLNIMFEHLWPAHFGLARRTIALPNTAWFDTRDLRHLHRVTRVWCKTMDAVEAFDALGKATSLIGFDSEDRFDAAIPRERSFFHLAGGSVTRGTERLLAVWRRHPEWPVLTVLQHPDCAPVDHSTSNICHLRYFLDGNIPAQYAELSRLQNSHLFHVCTSEIEGWGHYIVEALGVSAISFVADAPPMNELVTSERGLLVSYAGTGRMGLATTYAFDEASLETAVTQALVLPDEAIADMRANARQWFLENSANFVPRVRAALAELGA